MQLPNRTTPTLLRFALVVTAIVLGVVAQIFVSNGGLKWAITPYVVSIALILIAVSRQSTAAPSVDVKQADSDAPTSVGLLATLRRHRTAISLMTFSALLIAFNLLLFPKGPPYALAWWVYGLSVVVLMASIAEFEGVRVRAISRLRDGERFSVSASTLVQMALLIAIVVFALIVRLSDIREFPAGVWYDEAANLFEADRINSNPGATPPFLRVIPVFFLLPAAVLIKLIGVTAEAIRFTSVLFSVLGIVAVFTFMRLILGPAAALIGAFLLAVMRWDINFSRIGMVPVTMSLFTALTAYLVLRATRGGSYFEYAMAGLAIGVGMWFYASFQVFPLVLAFILIYGFFRHRPDIVLFTGRVVVMIAVALVVMAPLLQFAATDSEAYFGRLRQTSTFAIMPFDTAVDQTKDNFVKHFKMFHIEGDSNPRHNIPKEPMLDPLSGLLMVLGLAIVAVRWRNVALIALPVWVFVMLLPGIFTLPNEGPQALRAIGVIPALIALITLPIAALWTSASLSSHPLARRGAWGLTLALLAAIAFLNLNTFFGRQASDPNVYAAFSTDGTLIGNHMREQQARGYTLFSSRHFKFSLQIDLAANRPGYEVIRAPIDIPIGSSSLGTGATIYLEPREASAYRLLKAYYPDAHFEEVRPPSGGDVLYYLAIIDQEILEENRGLVANYALADGSRRDEIKLTSEGLWLTEFEAQDVPFDFDWTGSLHVSQQGVYTLALDGETDAEVLLNGERVLWSGQRSVTLTPAVGLHRIEVIGRVEDHASALRLLWQPPEGELVPIPQTNLYHGSISPVGLAGQFFEGQSEDGTPLAGRVTPALDTFWYDPVIPEPYTAVWRGSIDAPQTGEYRFKVGGVGKVSLTIDSKLRAQNPPRDGVESEATFFLSTGKHDIEVVYFSPTRPSEFKVLWAPPDEGLAPIPIDSLSPDSDGMFRIESIE